MGQQTSYGSITIRDTTDWTDMTVLYYKSNSSSIAPTRPIYNSNTNTISYNGWDDDPPAWENEKYVWQLYMYIYKDDLETTIANVEFSDPICLTGSNGADGQMLYGKCTTAANIQEKIVTLDSGTLTLTSGATIAVTFTNTNTANNPTLKVDSTAAKPIYIRNTTLTSTSNYNWTANSTIIFVYDNSGNNNNGCWQMDGTTVAATTATNYIVANENGIMVADMSNGVEDIDSAISRNIYINPYSVYIRNGTDILASFGETTTIGQTLNGKTRTYISPDGIRFYRNDNNSDIILAHIGYGDGEGNGESNSSSPNINIYPFYSLGQRLSPTGASNYNESRTYNVGDICIYNDKFYICIQKISTPESWNFSHWSYIIGGQSMVEGFRCTAAGFASHAEGNASIALGYASHAEGDNTIANGPSSHAEGNYTITSGSYSHAEGRYTFAKGNNSHTEGSNGTTASGTDSHAEGNGTTASGSSSHAEGNGTTASGFFSHAEGVNTIASDRGSHAQNIHTIASQKAQTAIGTYNIEDFTPSTAVHPNNDTSYGNYAFIIGNGTSDTNRSNALTVDWNGNIDTTGKIQINGNSLLQVGSEKSTTIASIPAGNASGVDIIIDNINGYIPIAIKSVRSSHMTSIMIGGWYFSTDSSNNPTVRIGYRNVTTSAISNVTFYATVLYAKNELLL